MIYSQAGKCLPVVRENATLHYYYLLHLRNFSIFYCILSLQSLIVTNDFRTWTSWTPDCFISRKVKLLKIIKTHSVINITKAYTQIFPKAATKKTKLLTHQSHVKFRAICNSQRQTTSFDNSLGNLIWIFFLGKRWQYKRNYIILQFQNISNNFSSLKTVYTAVKSVQNLRSWQNIQFCRYVELQGLR